MSGYALLWITLLLLAVQQSRRADAFQCYECEDCATIEEADVKYLRECVLPDTHIVRPTGTGNPEESEETEDISSELDQAPTSTPATSTTSTTTASIQTTTLAASTSIPDSSIQTSTIASTTTSVATTTVSLDTTLDLEEPIVFQNATDSDEDYELLANSTSIAEEAVVDNQTESEQQTTESSAENTTTQKKKKGSWSLFSPSKEQIDSRSEELSPSGELSQRSSRQLPGTRPMCYVLTIKYDGYEVTSRGCGAALPDRNLTCKMLSKGQTYSQCGLCEGNKCNSASTVRITLVNFFFVLFWFAVRSW